MRTESYHDPSNNFQVQKTCDPETMEGASHPVKTTDGELDKKGDGARPLRKKHMK